MEMTEFEKDLLLLGMIASSLDDSPMTAGAKAKPKERKNARMRGYFIGHKEVCLESYLFLMDISKSKLNALKRHYREKGLLIRKKNSGEYH